MKPDTSKTLNLSTMSINDLQDRLRTFGKRGKMLCGRTLDGKPLGQAVEAFFNDLLTSTTDAAKIAQRNELFERAQRDPAARQQLCAIRVETLNNYILSHCQIMPMFYEIIDLKPDERPVIQNTTDMQIKVSYITTDGGIKMTTVVKDDVETPVPLRMLTTDKVRYQAVDIYSGTIVDAALKVLRLAYDLANQEDALAYTLLLTGLASFTFTGKKATYPYVANSRINTANLPTTNDIVLSGNSGTTSFRYQVFRAARKYADQWGGCFPEGNLTPTGRILVPAAEASDIAEEIVPSGSTRNKVADALMESGYAEYDYLGMHWVIQIDNTLPIKSCLVEYNRKPGRVYHKPSLDKEMIRTGENDYALAQANEEERYNQKVFGAYLPTNLRVNFCRIQYKS